MSQDISKILAGWVFDPDKVTVRIVLGDDGRERVQLRIDLGLLQMEMHGRPDGLRPHDCECWLEHYRRRQAAAAADPRGRPFRLESDDCALLLAEGMQYYHRYLSFWNLGRYELCARDTLRNLRLFAFVRQYAAEEADKKQFEQWRPYVTMMHARAVGTPLLAAGDLTGALEAVERGIRGLEEFLREHKHTHRARDCAELNFLKQWRKEILSRQSTSGTHGREVMRRTLCDQLDVAVSEERYEEAARIRDAIRGLDEAPTPGAQP